MTTYMIILICDLPFCFLLQLFCRYDFDVQGKSAKNKYRNIMYCDINSVLQMN